jgi:hypothetical protein
MERDFVWHLQALAWIAVIVGVMMVATNIEVAGQIVAGIGLAVALVLTLRSKPSQSARPAERE